MACNQDVTDKLDNNKVESGALAVNTKRIRELTNDLKNATDCDHIKLVLGITGDEVDGLTKGIREEATSLVEKYLPIVKIPTNPLKIIPWVKKLVTGTIMPQLDAYIKLMRQVVGLVQAVNELVEAAADVGPKLKQCAVDTIDEELAGINQTIGDIKGAIDREVARIANEISTEITSAICESGIADLVGAVNDAISLTDQVIDSVKASVDTVDSIVSPGLQSIGTAGGIISDITGVPFQVNTTSSSAFAESVDSGKATEFSTGVNEFIAAAAPVNTTAPSLSGGAIVGSTLTVNNGVWTGNTITYSYSWFKNDEPIYGANASTYVPVANDEGYAILCSVSADNPAGGDIANTSYTSNVVSNVPVCTVAPVISGNAVIGETLSVTSGTWTSSPTITYQWVWAHSNTTITGANTSTYIILTEDGNQSISCVVTATIASGTSSNTASPTAIVPAAAFAGDVILDFGTF